MLVLSVSAAYCKLVFLCFASMYNCESVILQGWISLFNVSRSTMKATGYVILLYVVLYSARSWYISQEM